MIPTRIWEDQAEFNAQLRPLPTTYEGRVDLTKEFSLHMMTEITELLESCGIWQMHRLRHEEKYNPENVRRQLIDQYKYWVSIVQLWGFTPDELEKTYWRKSAAVRQRYAEEFIHQIKDREIVVLDIDNVLCDYTTGFGQWMLDSLYLYIQDDELMGHIFERVKLAMKHRLYMSQESLGIPSKTWTYIQHEYRVHGQAHSMPMMPGAREFIRKLHAMGLVVIALTSRPIDEYPNLRDDTVEWFHDNGILIDYIWWGTDKAEKLAKNLPALPNIRFVIDDDIRYIQQYMRMGVKTIYWYMQGYDTDFDPKDTAVIPITGFHDIKEIP